MRRLALALFVSLLAGVSAAHAEKRVGLVIGNAKYAHETQLRNPANDAREVAAALKRIKFDDVDVVLDADLIALQSALARFARKADAAALAVIYYSGHGIEVDGRNYLIPVSAKLADAGDVDFEAVPLDLAIAAADRAGKVKILVLDACRNNPFRARIALRQGRRSVGRGFAPVAAANGMLVAYSARAGTEADDGPPGGTSPFTTAFLKFVEVPRVEVRLMLGRVRDEVVRTTGRQEPFTYGSLGGDEVFLNAATAAPPPKATPAPTPPALPPTSEAERAWAVVKDTSSVASLEAFVRRFGDTFYGDLAKERIATLKQAEAERQRLAMLQQEEERRRAEAEAARKRAEAADTAKAGRTFRDCPDCPEMVVVPAGSFTMGSNPAEIAALEKQYSSEHYRSEGPQRKVTIARPFAVGRYEVTFAEWDACVAAGACKHNPGDAGWGRGKRPVINVSWDDITKEYLPWLSRKTGKAYRLLTEAEWEYAARGVTSASAPSKRYWWGDQASHEYANYGKDQCCSGHKEGRDQWENTAPVGQFAANPFGLHDMHGNVWEWVEDCWHGTYQGAPVDGSAWTTHCTESGRRVLRGGSWSNVPVFLRSAFRNWYSTDVRGDDFGFRVGRTLTP